MSRRTPEASQPCDLEAQALRLSAEIALARGEHARADELARESLAAAARARAIEPGRRTHNPNRHLAIATRAAALVRGGRTAEGTALLGGIDESGWITRSLVADVLRDAAEATGPDAAGATYAQAARERYEALVDQLRRISASHPEDREPRAFLGCAAVALVELSASRSDEHAAELLALGLTELRTAWCESVTLAPVADRLQRGLLLHGRRLLRGGDQGGALAVVDELLAIAAQAPDAAEWEFAAACLLGHVALAGGDAAPALGARAAATLRASTSRGF